MQTHSIRWTSLEAAKGDEHNCKQTCLEALARQMYDRKVIGKS